MVAAIGGSGLGLFGSSLSALGGAGLVGNAGVGRGGDRVYVNTATGNLIVQSQDEALSALGLDLTLIRTYNSQGLFNDDNGDNWRLGVHQRVYGLSGTLNTAGSTITKVFGDGREVVYQYNVAQSRYVSAEGDGAHDTLTNSSGTWTWTDGSSRGSETYDSSGRLTESRDTDGNATTYTYTGSLLTQITDASGQTTYLDYSGNNLTQIRVVSNGQTQTLTRYSYDGSNRLTEVRVDLTPADNSVVDNHMYTTTYTYEGTSRRIASLTQADGASVTFTYEVAGGQYRVKTYTDALGRVTTLDYSNAGGGSIAANNGVLSTTETTTAEVEVPPYYVVQTGDTWESIAQALYGDALLANSLQGQLGNPTLLQPQQLLALPSLLADSGTGVNYALGGTVPVEQTYYDGSRLLATRHTDGSITTYGYDRFGNLATRRRHAQASVEPLWLQDFSQNADGIAPLHSGFMTLENGALTLTTRNDVPEQWAESYGTRTHAFDDHIVYRGEVTTNGATGHHFFIGAQNTGGSRMHGVLFLDGQIYSESLDASGWHRKALTTATANTTYIVEIQTHAQGTTVYLREKGTDRQLAFQHTAMSDLADWQTSLLYLNTYGATNVPIQSVRLDNLSETSALGELVGGKIVVDAAQDQAVSFLQRHEEVQANLSGQANSANLLTYAIEVPEGASVLSVDLQGASFGDPDLYLRYAAPASSVTYDYFSTGSGTNRIVVPSPAAGTWYVAVHAATDFSGATLRMSYDTPQGNDRSYTVQGGDTWGSIAQTLYGNAALADELQAALGSPTLRQPQRLTDLPTTLTRSIPTRAVGVLDGTAGSAVPVAQAYYDENNNRLLATRHTDGSVTTYEYDRAGNLVARRQHAQELLEPSWFQDFTQNTGGLAPLSSGFITHENGGLTFATRNDVGVQWPTIYGTRVHGSENMVYRGEVTTGGGSAGRHFAFGAMNSGGYYAHGAAFLDGNLYAVYLDASGSHQVLLGAAQDNTTYVVEVVMHAQGTTLYVHEKGVDRQFGFKHSALATPSQWGTSRMYASTYGGSAASIQSVRLDNLSEASTLGELIGSKIAVADAQDDVDSFLNRHEETHGALSAEVNDPLLTYTIDVPAGASQLSIDLTGTSAADLYLRYGAPASQNTHDYSFNGRIALPSPTAGTWHVAVRATASFSNATLRMSYDRSPLADRSYTVQSGDTWSSIAQALYGNAALADELQAALGSPTLTVNAVLSSLPQLLMEEDDTVATNKPLDLDAVVTRELQEVTHTVAPYYTVQQGDTWETITATVYGTNESGAVVALQAALSNPTLTAGLHLTVPQTLHYSSAQGSFSAQTDVTDALGGITTLVHDEQGRLLKVLSPTVAGTRLETRYAYDTDGNVTSIIEDPSGLNRTTALSYDSDGNLLSTRDNIGNTVTRTYSADNQLLTETRYLGRDPDGAGAGQPSVPLTVRYVYDSEDHLRFVISAQGRVTEHRYNTAGERITTLKYASGLYTASPFAESDLATWAGTQDLSQLERLEYAYDFRGNLATLTAYAATNASGAGTGTPSITKFVYDQRGQLLQQIEARGSATMPDPANANLPYARTYTYDGLGRVLSSTQWNSASSLTTTLSAYDDANRLTTTTLANGLITTSTYNRAGELISVIQGTSGASNGLGTTTYAYDAAGRLRIATDPAGVRRFYFYDEAGRKSAEIDGDGTLTEFIYNRASELIKTVQYAAQVDSTTLASLVDTQGNPTAVTLATVRTAANGNPTADRLTRNVYDSAGQLIFTIDEVGAVTQFFYDGAGRVTDEVRYANPVTITRSVDQVLQGDFTVTTSADDRHTRNFYDADGKLLGTLDGAGYLVEYKYDPAGYLFQQIAYATRTNASYWLAGTLDQLRPASDTETTLTPERDLVSYFFYDGEGRRIGALDAEGYLTETMHDVAGNILQTTRYGRALSYTAGTSTFQTLKTAATAVPVPTTHTTSYQYDGQGRLSQETNHEGTVTTYRYDNVGKLISTTRAQGTAEARTTEARYDFLGRVIGELTAEGSALITGGMTQQQIDDIWDRSGVTYAYDLAGRKISATMWPSGTQANKTRYFYDNDNRLRFEVNALGEVKENRYNTLGQLTDTIAYTNRISTAGLSDGVIDTTLTDRVAAAANTATDARTTLTYTLRGQVATTTTAESASTSRTYNAFGEEQTRLQQLNATATLRHEYTYDKHGQLTLTRWDPLGLNTTEANEYDAFGRLSRTTDANGNVRRRQYDRLGRAIATFDALNAQRATTYDAFSRVLTTTDALGNETTYSYDDVARGMTVTTPEGIAASTIHSRHGQTLSVSAAGNTTSYNYDLNGQLIGTSDSLGTLESRTYDRAGRQLTSTDARGITTQFSYDAANRVLTRIVDSVSGGLALTTSYEYDGQGRVFRVTDASNVVTETTYDRDGRVTQVAVDPSALNIRTTYGYDRAGRVIAVTEGAGSANPRVVQYTYDNLGRRIQEVVDPAAQGLQLTTDYQYDANGNLVLKNDPEGNRTLYAYDAENRLRFVVDALYGITETTHDAAGRIVATTRYGGYLDAEQLEPGPLSAEVIAQTPRISESNVMPPDRVERYVYDADGRETFKIDAMGGVTRKQYDDNGRVVRQVMYSERIPATAYATVQQVEAALLVANDNNVANDRESGTVYDVRGQARYAIDGLGGVVRYEYDAAGNLVAQTAFSTAFAGSATPTLAAIDTWAASHTQVADRITRMWHDSVNRVRFTLDAEGYLRERRYDAVGRVTAEIIYSAKPTIGTNATTQGVESAAAAIANMSADQRTSTLYDHAGRVSRVTDATGAFDSFTYDAVGKSCRIHEQEECEVDLRL